MNKRTREIYQFIRAYMIVYNGKSPTLREIAAHVSNEKPLSTSVVFYHLRQLESAGLIDRANDETRNIQLPGAAYIPPPMPLEMVK